MTRRKKSEGRPAARHSLPLTGYESISRCVPRLRETAKGAALAVRGEQSDPNGVVHPGDVGDLPGVQAFLTKFARREAQRGATREQAYDMANLVGCHLFCAINHELHRRKVFWVDEALAYMLLNTDLDIQGACLGLPFPAFCVVFTDPESLGLAADVADAAGGEIAGEPIGVLSVYVTRVDEVDAPDLRGINLTFAMQSTVRDWPYIIARDIIVRPEDTLAEILASHFSDASPDQIFNHPSLTKLVQLVINAILYASSAQFEGVQLRPPRTARSGKPSDGAARLSALEVVHLPGKIDISVLRGSKSAKTREGHKIIATRFMVRGHWRRANLGWADQRLRWIEPYWKGPEMATIIEQEYRMRP